MNNDFINYMMDNRDRLAGLDPKDNPWVIKHNGRIVERAQTQDGAMQKLTRIQPHSIWEATRKDGYEIVNEPVKEGLEQDASDAFDNRQDEMEIHVTELLRKSRPDEEIVKTLAADWELDEKEAARVLATAKQRINKETADHGLASPIESKTVTGVLNLLKKIREGVIKSFWVVTTPTKESTIDDICFEATPAQLAMQAHGGLNAADIEAVYDNEKEARIHADGLLKGRTADEGKVPDDADPEDKKIAKLTEDFDPANSIVVNLYKMYRMTPDPIDELLGGETSVSMGKGPNEFVIIADKKEYTVRVEVSGAKWSVVVDGPDNKIADDLKRYIDRDVALIAPEIIGEHKLTEDGRDPEDKIGDDVKPDEEGPDIDRPRDPANPAPAEGEEQQKDTITKEYIGKKEETHFYMVGTPSSTPTEEEGADTPEDLQIVDQEGKKLWSASEQEIDPSNPADFLIQAIQELEIDEITRSVLVKYILPELTREDEETEPEEIADEEPTEDADTAAGKPDEALPTGEEEERRPFERKSKTGSKKIAERCSARKVVMLKETHDEALWDGILKAIEDKDSKWEAVVTLMAEVWNGGFEQWIDNGIAEEEGHLAIRMLHKIGTEAAEKMAALAEEAMRSDFYGMAVTDRNIKNQSEEEFEHNAEQLDPLDNEFYGGLDDQLVKDLAAKLGVGKTDEAKIPDDADPEDTKINKLIETKVQMGDDTFEVAQVDDGSDDVVIDINGQEYRFEKDFAAMWRDEATGDLTSDGLQELALDALSNMEEDEYAQLVAAGDKRDDWDRDRDEERAARDRKSDQDYDSREEDRLARAHADESKVNEKGAACTKKEKRQVKHIEKSEKAAGKPAKKAEQVAHATVNKQKNEAKEDDAFEVALNGISEQVPTDDIIDELDKRFGLSEDDAKNVVRRALKSYIHSVRSQLIKDGDLTADEIDANLEDEIRELEDLDRESGNMGADVGEAKKKLPDAFKKNMFKKGQKGKKAAKVKESKRLPERKVTSGIDLLKGLLGMGQ